MSSVAWIARCAQVPGGADLCATLHDATGRAGYLAAWRCDARPDGVDARRVDRRLLDADGEEGLLSLVLPDEDRLVAFDDLAVQHARRRVLAEAPADALSTLLIDDRRFAGALTVRRGPDAARLLADDPFAPFAPFARIAPATLLSLGPGLIGRVPAPTGPTIERHGSAQPWPWERFPGDHPADPAG